MAAPLVCSLVLAAGEASRFGGPKALARVGELTLLNHAQAQCVGLGEMLMANKVMHKSILLLGAYEAAIRSELDSTDWDALISVSDWQVGMSASIQEGFKQALALANQLGVDLHGVIVLLVDQPLLCHDDVRALVSHGLHSNTLCCARYPQSVGPPAYFPLAAVESFLALRVSGQTGKGGAKEFLKENKAVVFDVRGVLDDVDTEADLERVNTLFKSAR